MHHAHHNIVAATHHHARSLPPPLSSLSLSPTPARHWLHHLPLQQHKMIFSSQKGASGYVEKNYLTIHYRFLGISWDLSSGQRCTRPVTSREVRRRLCDLPVRPPSLVLVLTCVIVELCPSFAGTGVDGLLSVGVSKCGRKGLVYVSVETLTVEWKV